jgi:hypothetical protein
MPPNKNQSNYSKRPVRRVRLLKIGLRKTESLLEEYFYSFVVVICVVVAILGKAAGLSGYNAVVMGLWAGGFTWFAGLVRRYRKEQKRSGLNEKSREPVQAPPQIIKQQLPPNMKPMIGPQWPLKNKAGRTRPVQWPQPPKTTASGQTPAVPSPPGQSASSDENRPAFVYERPTLPDRKPKLPNNWAGPKGKKPKR